MAKMTLTCDLCGKVYQSYQCGKYNHFCSIECRRKGAHLMSENITEVDRKRRSDQIIRVNKTINNLPEKIESRRKSLIGRPPVKRAKVSSPRKLTPRPPVEMTPEQREHHRQVRLDESSTGYRKYYGRHEHRVVAEQMLGRPLKPGEIVHHIDGNKRNNDPSNLRVMTQSEHIKLHLAAGGGRL